MGRRATTGKTGRVLHTYAPNALAARVEELITTRAYTESQILNKALEIALPTLELNLPVALPEQQAAFNEKRARRTYKHKRNGEATVVAEVVTDTPSYAEMVRLMKRRDAERVEITFDPEKGLQVKKAT